MFSDRPADPAATVHGAAALPDTPSLWPATAHRIAQRSAKYQAVLAAAARLFCEQGFHAAALDDVADRLRVSKPTLYYYVRSKKALVAACAEQGLENALQTMQMAGEGQSPSERLRACLRAYAHAVATDFGWCMVRAAELPADLWAASPAGGAAAQLGHLLQRMDAGLTADQTRWLLLAVEGVACTGGRRAPMQVAVDVEQLLQRLCPEVARVSTPHHNATPPVMAEPVHIPAAQTQEKAALAPAPDLLVGPREPSVARAKASLRVEPAPIHAPPKPVAAAPAQLPRVKSPMPARKLVGREQFSLF